MIAFADQEFGFDYTEATGETGLDVAAKIYDVSGAPVLLSTVAMTDNGDGSYYAKFTGDAGKTYKIFKAVYIDGTFTTVDTEYGVGTDMIQCVEPSGGSAFIGGELTMYLEQSETILVVEPPSETLLIHEPAEEVA